MEMEKALTLWEHLECNMVTLQGRYPARPLARETLAIRIFLLVLAAITGYALSTIDLQGMNLMGALSDTFKSFTLIFLHPNTLRLSLADAFVEVVITMGMAFLATLFGAVIALFLGLLGARNLAPNHITFGIKAFVAFIRAIPTILWVLIFAVAAGLGSTAAVIGMTFHSVSYLTKAYAESFEDLDKSVIEALKASGAGWWQIVFQAVIPSCSTYLLSWTFLRLEINFANAVAMGAAAGAAGIGFDLYMAGSFYFDLHEVGLITYMILCFALVLEAVATRMKRGLKRER